MIPDPLPDRFEVPLRRSSVAVLLAAALMLVAFGVFVAVPDGYWRVARAVGGSLLAVGFLVPAIRIGRRMVARTPVLLLDAAGLALPLQTDLVGPVAWAEVTRVEAVPVFRRGLVVMLWVRDPSSLRRPRPWWRQRSFADLDPDLAIDPFLTTYDAAGLVALIEAYRRGSRSRPGRPPERES